MGRLSSARADRRRAGAARRHVQGPPGKYATIQAAVDAARPGDWILVAPGDYHETDDATHPPTADSAGGFGGVYITTPNVHLRGMDRTTVIVDGTKPGSSTPCSSDPTLPELRRARRQGGAVRPQRHRGVEGQRRQRRQPHRVQLPRRVRATSGNEIWWNGGADTGKIGLHGYSGAT